MATDLLPLFPLAVVLFPRTHLPLHIFEDRYKEMIGNAIRAGSEFGIVLAGEKGIVENGCTAIVDKVTQRYPDGRMDIEIVGVRRFEIHALDTEKSYLRGNVSFFNDDETETVAEDLRRRTVEAFQALQQILAQEATDPDWSDPQLSFQLAHAVPDLEFRQRLLSCRSESERMRQLVEYLPVHAARQRHSSHVKAVAPWNGRGPSVPQA
jgi:Lon protease-like protein